MSIHLHIGMAYTRYKYVVIKIYYINEIFYSSTPLNSFKYVVFAVIYYSSNNITAITIASNTVLNTTLYIQIHTSIYP